MSASSLEEGGGRQCRQCGGPINGLLCFSGPRCPVPWGCGGKPVLEKQARKMSVSLDVTEFASSLHAALLRARQQQSKRKGQRYYVAPSEAQQMNAGGKELRRVSSNADQSNLIKDVSRIKLGRHQLKPFYPDHADEEMYRKIIKSLLAMTNEFPASRPLCSQWFVDSSRLKQTREKTVMASEAGQRDQQETCFRAECIRPLRRRGDLRGGGKHEDSHGGALQKVSISDNLEENTLDIYKACARDFIDGRLHIESGPLAIAWDAMLDVPEERSQSLPSSFRSIATNGGGACALHANFGRPTFNAALNAFEMEQENARSKCAALLAQLAPEALIDARKEGVRKKLQKFVWEEIALPYLKGSRSCDRKMLWDALQKCSPEVVADMLEFQRASDATKRKLDNAKQAATVASRNLFDEKYESTLI